MSTDLASLLSFGFDERKAKRALRKTKNSGLQPALDYLQDHEDSSGEDSEDGNDDDAAAGPSIPEPAGEAKSIKCSDCGKIFRSVDEAQYHGTKSGHSNFEESTEEKKPLTEQEKSEKLEELKRKAAERKAAKAKTDAEEAKRNEEIRRKGGKEMGQIKEELKIKEAQKAAAERIQEKKDDIAARNRVKAQIEADKKERAEKFAKEKAIREGRPVEMSASEKAGPRPPAANTLQAGASQKSETRLQIRLPSGNPLITTKKPDDTLQSVLEWVHQNNSAGVAIQGNISIPFPRKTFSQQEMGKTLLELGLVPSSVLIIN